MQACDNKSSRGMILENLTKEGRKRSVKKKKLMSLFAGTLVFSIACSTVVASPLSVALAAEREAVESEVGEASKAADSAAEDGVIGANPNIQYLSDMQEEPGASVGYWGQIFKDCLVNKGNEKKDNLWVRYNSETLKFAKGIGAHATSTVVYNITDVVKTKKYFVGYLGIDARTSSADGVTFKISLSDDNKTWEEVYNSGVVKNDAQYVKIDLKNKKYIKFYADKNAHNGNDHAVYANAGFVAENYKPSDGYTLPVKTVEEYDAELSKIDYKNEQQVKTNTHKIYQRELVDKAGFYTLYNVYTMQNGVYKDAMNYLLTNEDALSYYINGGPKPAQGTYYNSLIAFGKIYNAHKEDLKDTKENNFNLRLAISVASVYANPGGVRFWQGKYQGQDPVRRYETYKELSKDGGKMDLGAALAKENKIDNGKWSAKEFRELSVPMMRWVVDARMNEDEFNWLADYSMACGKGDKKNFLDSYTYMKYELKEWKYEDEKYYSPENKAKWTQKYKLDGYFDEDKKYGASIDGNKIVRLWTVWEEGGVCGAFAKSYTNLAEVFGRPSITCGQPGHAAAVTWMWNPRGGENGTGQYEWRIQNDVFNWRETHSEFSDYMLGWGNRTKDKDGQASSYVTLTTDVLEGKWDTYVEAKRYTLLANSFTDTQKKEEILDKALQKEPKFLDAWYGKLDMRLANDKLTSEEALSFAKAIEKTFKYYPMVMSDLLAEIRAKVTDTSHQMELDTLRRNALLEASALKDNDYEKSGTRQPNVARIVAEGLLKNATALATFSFDGEDAGKLVINSNYDTSTVRVRYSLDGGKTWTNTTLEGTEEHKISLVDKLAEIQPDTDIKVGLVGTDIVHTIDILPAVSPKNKVYLNDKEDLFVGDVKSLEYSKDGGKIWQPYPQDGLKNELRFTGDQNVLIRYRAHGTYVASETEAYAFKNAEVNEKNKYLQLQHVTLEKFSSQNNNTTEAAANLLDGNPNTKYHSNYGIRDEKELVFKFDQSRYISSIEYVPSSSVNGRWKQIEILGSNDGATWESLTTSEVLENNMNAKQILLNSSEAWTYLKVKGLETYSSDNRPNMFFSGSMVNFYEDITKDIVEAPKNVAVSGIEETSATVTWDAVEGVKGYNVYVGDEKVNTELLTETNFVLTDLTAETEYTVSVEAISEKDMPSAKTSAKFTTVPHVVAKPTEVKANKVGETTATIIWKGTDTVDGYNIYLGDEKVNQELVKTTSYDLTNLTAETEYTVSVEAVEKDGAVSEKVTVKFQTAKPGEEIFVEKPTEVNADQVGETTAVITWKAVEGAESYNIYLNGEKKNEAPLTETTYELVGLTDGTEYTVGVEAVGKNNSHSESTEITFTTKTHVVPVPEEVEANNITETTATITWKAPTGAEGYNIYVGDKKVNTELVIGTHYDLTGLLAETGYTVFVEAVEAGGKVSEKVSVNFTTAKREEVVTPTPEEVKVGNITAHSAVITWIGAEGVAGYNVYVNGEKINAELITGTRCELRDLKAGTVYTVNVEAVGLDNQTSTQKTITFVTDQQSPITPGDGETSGTPNGEGNTEGSGDKTSGGGDPISRNPNNNVRKPAPQTSDLSGAGNSMMMLGASIGAIFAAVKRKIKKF